MQRIKVVLTDDLNGRKANETVKFSLDGTDYEIDLTAANAKKFRVLVSKYTAAGRRVRKSHNSKTATSGHNGQPRNGQSHSGLPLTAAQRRDIREWARDQGKARGSRGKIPQAIVDEYFAQTANNGNGSKSTSAKRFPRKTAGAKV